MTKQTWQGGDKVDDHDNEIDREDAISAVQVPRAPFGCSEVSLAVVQHLGLEYCHPALVVVTKLLLLTMMIRSKGCQADCCRRRRGSSDSGGLVGAHSSPMSWHTDVTDGAEGPVVIAQIVLASGVIKSRSPLSLLLWVMQ